jgi:hypothetical protein
MDYIGSCPSEAFGRLDQDVHSGESALVGTPSILEYRVWNRDTACHFHTKSIRQR